jgi:hypothetical protein
MARRAAQLSERRRRRRQRLARAAAGAAQTGVEARGRERRWALVREPGGAQERCRRLQAAGDAGTGCGSGDAEAGSG